MLVSIVIPCYNSEHTIEKVTELCQEEFARMADRDLEMVLVNDYSRDATYEKIKALTERYPNVKGISLAKNFGQHAAIMAGLKYAEGDIVIGMDDDLQTHPSQIPVLLAGMDEGYDVVFGHFRQKKAGFMKILYSNIGDFFLDHLVDMPRGVHMNNFWAARKYVIDQIRDYRGCDAFVQLLFFRTTHNMKNVEIEHFRREEGKSNYTFRKGLKLLLTVSDYSIIPLRFSSVLGVLFSLIGLISAAAVIINKLVRPDVAIGWSSLMCAMLILFGFMFLMLGVIGEYVGKSVLIMNETPLYVIKEKSGCFASGGKIPPDTKISHEI